MSLKVLASEVGVAFHDIDYNGAPGFDIAGLGFVEKDKGTNDVGTETMRTGQYVLVSEEKVTYGISAASVSARLLLRSSPSSWYIRNKILT